LKKERPRQRLYEKSSSADGTCSGTYWKRRLQMNGEKKSIVGVKLANHKIITVFSGEENAGHAVFTTVADNQKKAIFKTTGSPQEA